MNTAFLGSWCLVVLAAYSWCQALRLILRGVAHSQFYGVLGVSLYRLRESGYVQVICLRYTAADPGGVLRPPPFLRVTKASVIAISSGVYLQLVHSHSRAFPRQRVVSYSVEFLTVSYSVEFLTSSLCGVNSLKALASVRQCQLCCRWFCGRLSSVGRVQSVNSLRK